VKKIEWSFNNEVWEGRYKGRVLFTIIYMSAYSSECKLYSKILYVDWGEDSYFEWHEGVNVSHHDNWLAARKAARKKLNEMRGIVE
jgi:hypothetical protein